MPNAVVCMEMPCNSSTMLLIMSLRCRNLSVIYHHRSILKGWRCTELVGWLQGRLHISQLPIVEDAT